MSVLARGRAVPAPPYQTLKRQALSFLITADWLIGEAADHRTPICEHGPAASASAPARTPSDAKLELAKERAATKIRQCLEATVPKVTAAEIDRYYKQRIEQFAHREQRLFYIEEDLSSRVAALSRRREFELGKARIAKTAGTLYESLERPADMLHATPIVKAIFSARPRVVLGPFLENRTYYLMQVTRISSPRVTTLAQAANTIRGGLASAHWQQTLARFVNAWRRKWTARTDCSSGYIVQKCRQYRGTKAPEDPVGLS